MQHNPLRRLLIKGITATCLLAVSRIGLAALVQIIAVRVWPSSTYTRITLESNTTLNYKQFELDNPSRVVIDLTDIHLNPTLKSINTLVQPQDPYIKQIRIGQFNKSTVRLVIELKQKVNPSLFTLKPFSEFRYRLVADLYPEKFAQGDDPLLALLEEFNKGSLDKEQGNIRSIKPAKGPLIVVLDPGHGGEDPGAIGRNGTKEKNVVLQIARRLRNLIKKEPNIKVYMTRDEDVFIPLGVRVAKARKLQADIFISIHADAFTQRSVRGSSVFALSTRGATSTAASYLAQTQNDADLIGGVSKSGDRYLDHTIFDLLQTATVNDSLTLGSSILMHMKRANQLHKNVVEQAGFAVLKAPDVPSILVETAFISNVEEEKKLKTADFQNKLAQAMLKGIKEYAAKKRG